MSQYLRPKDAAARLGLAVQTLARWRVEGSPIPYSKIGRLVLYSTADVDAYVTSRRRQSTAAPERTAPPSGRAA